MVNITSDVINSPLLLLFFVILIFSGSYTNPEQNIE